MLLKKDQISLQIIHQIKTNVKVFFFFKKSHLTLLLRWWSFFRSNLLNLSLIGFFLNRIFSKSNRLTLNLLEHFIVWNLMLWNHLSIKWRNSWKVNYLKMPSKHKRCFIMKKKIFFCFISVRRCYWIN